MNYNGLSVVEFVTEYRPSLQSLGRVTQGRKIVIEILNLLPLREIHLTFYMENAYSKHSFLILCSRPAFATNGPAE